MPVRALPAEPTAFPGRDSLGGRPVDAQASVRPDRTAHSGDHSFGKLRINERHLGETKIPLSLQLCQQMPATQQAFRSLFSRCNLRRTLRIDPEDEPITQVRAKLHRHVRIRTLGGKDEIDAGGSCLDAQALHDGRRLTEAKAARSTQKDNTGREQAKLDTEGEPRKPKVDGEQLKIDAISRDVENDDYWITLVDGVVLNAPGSVLDKGSICSFVRGVEWSNPGKPRIVLEILEKTAIAA